MGWLEVVFFLMNSSFEALVQLSEQLRCVYQCFTLIIESDSIILKDHRFCDLLALMALKLPSRVLRLVVCIAADLV